MSDTALAVVKPDAASVLADVITKGDLAKLTPDQRVSYYRVVAESIGVNPLTRPFEYIILNGKLTLYALKGCTDQLRKIHGISIPAGDVRTETTPDGVYVVTVRAVDRDGREDTDSGAVSVGGLKGPDLANAYMKALTKAKRRVTLSICGLGMLDESEVDAIPAARPVAVDLETGAIADPAPIRTLSPAPQPDRLTDAQRKKIFACLRQLNVPEDHQTPLIHGWEHVASTNDLSRQAAARVIDMLELACESEDAANDLRAAAARFAEAERAAAEVVDGETGEIVNGDIAAEASEADALEAIRQARTAKDLEEIAAWLGQHKIKTAAVVAAYKAKATAIGKQG